MDSSGVGGGTPQSETAFLTPDGSPLSSASYNVLQRIGSRHGIETMVSGSIGYLVCWEGAV